MRKNFGAKPYLYPQPVFIVAAYDENGTTQLMNAAWGCVSDMNEVCVVLSPGHKTTKSILASGAFTISMATADTVTACDYVGIVSGNNVPNKLEKSGLHSTRSEFVNAPLIDELPMTLECKLRSYDTESHFMLGEIINVSADESILNEAGKVDVAKLRPITFDAVNSAYVQLGEKVGNAFSDGNALK